VLPGEARTLAETVRALARAAPSHPRLPLLTEALVGLGKDGGWGDPNADASALLALSERIRTPAAPVATVRVEAGGESVTLVLGPEAAAATWRGDTQGPLELVLASGAGPVATRVRTTWVPLGSGAEVPARNAGFVVTRTEARVRRDGPSDRFALDAPGQVLAWKVGDVVECVVQVANPEDRTHVVVEVPLAAGVEPLNPALATAPPEARPSHGPTLAPTWADYRDAAVTFAYDRLPRGTYDLVFRVRASTPGRFVQPPARAEAMYDASVSGTSPGAVVTVE
jgi:alpha-2-macroglobulin